MKKFDTNSIMSEYPDEFIRKMRLTGLISLRGAGRFIDINHIEDTRVEYVLKEYMSYKKYSTEREYFNYMAKIDPKLIAIKSATVSAATSENLLKNWTKVYNWDCIKKELNILSGKKDSKDLTLRIIPAPARLEFLAALAIITKFPTIRVIPNYSCDDTGLPSSTAGGGKGDIDCLEHPNGILVEVTMAVGRNQTIMEVWPIERHLEDFKKKYTPNSECVFVAPSIYADSERQIKFVKYDTGATIRPYSIDDFVKMLEGAKRLYSV